MSEVPAQPSSGRTLLLADDSSTIHRIVELSFACEDVRVVCVSDGPQALAAFADERPDVALISISLPRLSGYEVATSASRLPGGRQTPILLLGGAFDIIDDGRAREVGAAGVLYKPFEPALVIRRVKELLGITRPDRPEPAPVAAEPPPAAADESAGAVRPEPQHVEPATAAVDAVGHGDDYFAQLDSAFRSLDAQLAGEPAMPASSGAVASEPRDLRSGAEAAPSFAPFSESGARAPERGPAPENPVFEVDEGWFNASALEPESLLRPSHTWSPRDETQAFVEETWAPPVRPEAPISPRPVGAADAFAALLAEEQGETPPPPPAPPPLDLSDEALNRLAERVARQLADKVAERLLHGLFEGSLRQTVNEVSERLVREEIARIRAAAQSQSF